MRSNIHNAIYNLRCNNFDKMTKLAEFSLTGHISDTCKPVVETSFSGSERSFSETVQINKL